MGFSHARRLALLCPLAAAALFSSRCDNVTCRTITADLATACIPDAIEVDREVRIEVKELCGLNCPRIPACKATLVNGVVVLDVHEDQCNDILINQCAQEACLQRVVGCKLPPLSQGDYTLRATGMGDRLIRVRPGGAAACQLVRTQPDGGI